MKSKTIDEYLADVEPEKRRALGALRKTIKKLYPGVEECISYGIPAFRLNGKLLVWFGAGAHHCALYPGGVVETMNDELRGYETSKGTVRFPPGKPLPAVLVKKLIDARLARGGVRKKATGRARASSRGGRR
ncbi:MAG TPA: DUF1801 domain-containing protein [Candidatus Polarisedimenticolaceae bacterium]|nr:DUF1801 domain-containing protein [Candidatus Polarisedimenticolaceae bacterium]